MTHKIPLIYVAGPYTAPTSAEVDTNIMRAREAGKVVCGLGAYPIIPHANTSHFEGAAPDSFWLPATLEACRRCDAILILRGWQSSKGTLGELELMRDLHRPIFFEVDPTWQMQVSKLVAEYQEGS